WSLLGHKTLLDYESWPKWDERLIAEGEFDLIIQVNGRTRGTVKVAKEIPQNEAESVALASESAKKWIGTSPVKKTIFVKNRLINFIV
ncbi:MAG: leucine--tRNA ligase, partial [Patescibacteria group bacterium]